MNLFQTGPGVVITLDEAAQMGDLEELRAKGSTSEYNGTITTAKARLGGVSWRQ